MKAINLNNKYLTIDIIYFTGSTLFFYLQLNIAINFAYYSNLSLWQTFLALLLFKTGEFLHEKFDGGNSRIWLSMLLISAILIVLYPKLSLVYMIFSLSMMKIRDAARVYSSKRVKVYGRALGFLLAPFNYPYVFLIMTILLVIIAYIKRASFYDDTSHKFYSIKSRTNRLSYAIMGVHHAHYFVYAYTILFIFSQHETIPIFLIGLIFYLGWAAYNAYEKLLKPRWIYFIIGHIIAALSLLGLYFSNNTFITLVLWFMTGLGGGTIYMVNDLIIDKGKNTSRELRIAEGIGHLTGILLWGLLSILYGLRVPVLAGFILSFITVILAILQSNKSNSKTKIMNSNLIG